MLSGWRGLHFTSLQFCIHDLDLGRGRRGWGLLRILCDLFKLNKRGRVDVLILNFSKEEFRYRCVTPLSASFSKQPTCACSAIAYPPPPPPPPPKKKKKKEERMKRTSEAVQLIPLLCWQPTLQPDGTCRRAILKSYGITEPTVLLHWHVPQGVLDTTSLVPRAAIGMHSGYSPLHKGTLMRSARHCQSAYA